MFYWKKKILSILNVPLCQTKSRRLNPHNYWFFHLSYALVRLLIEILKSSVKFLYLKLFLISLLKFKVHHITKFRLDLVDFNPADEEPWYGEFIEIRFSNKSTYHCGVENYNEISDSLELKPTCKLEI